MVAIFWQFSLLKHCSGLYKTRHFKCNKTTPGKNGSTDLFLSVIALSHRRVKYLSIITCFTWLNSLPWFVLSARKSQGHLVKVWLARGMAVSHKISTRSDRRAARRWNPEVCKDSFSAVHWRSFFAVCFLNRCPALKEVFREWRKSNKTVRRFSLVTVSYLKLRRAVHWGWNWEPAYRKSYEGNVGSISIAWHGLQPFSFTLMHLRAFLSILTLPRKNSKVDDLLASHFV